MAIDSIPEPSMGNHGHDGIDPAKVIPGTTFPSEDQPDLATSPPTTPASKPGPQINGKPTTITLYNPPDLAQCTCLGSLFKVVNAAFSISHDSKGLLPSGINRLRTDDQFVKEIGSDPGTFTYIMTYTGTDEMVGTASAQRWYGAMDEVVLDDEGRSQTFKRKGKLEPDVENWELRLMAVSSDVQRQGVAGLLMRMVDEEVVRRFRRARELDGEQLRLVMILTTITEVNADFYARKGYAEDYESKFPPGWMGSENGFGVVHMSRWLET